MNPELQEQINKATAQVEADKALAAIRDRSFSGRNPHLGRMINCQFCNLRHRENERKCEQKFVTANREGDPVQGELIPLEGLTGLTARQVLGASYFAKRRIKPHSNRWAQARANKKAAAERKEKENKQETE